MENEDACTKVARFGLVEFPDILLKALGQADGGVLRAISNKKTQYMVRSHLQVLLKFLRSLQEDEMIVFCLQHVNRLVGLFFAFKVSPR